MHNWMLFSHGLKLIQGVYVICCIPTHPSSLLQSLTYVKKFRLGLSSNRLTDCHSYGTNDCRNKTAYLVDTDVTDVTEYHVI